MTLHNPAREKVVTFLVCDWSCKSKGTTRKMKKASSNLVGYIRLSQSDKSGVETTIMLSLIRGYGWHSTYYRGLTISSSYRPQISHRKWRNVGSQAYRLSDGGWKEQIYTVNIAGGKRRKKSDEEEKESRRHEAFRNMDPSPFYKLDMKKVKSFLEQTKQRLARGYTTANFKEIDDSESSESSDEEATVD